MGILSRCADIMSANINDFLDKLEDKNAEKMIDQKLRQCREDLARVKDETSTVMANETAAKRALDDCKAEVNKFANAAMNAVRAGDDDGARKLLQKKQSLETKQTGLQEAYDAAHQDAENMRAMYDKLVDDIEKLENRADVLKGKVAVAKAREHANKVTAGVSSATSAEGFDRMEGRINKRLDKANAVSQLNDRAGEVDDLAAKYGSSASGSVEDELAKMKAQLQGDQQ